MQYRFNIKCARAFTLIEMVVVIAILSVMTTAVCSMILYFYKTNTYVIQEGDAVQNAQNGLNTAMKNLREASYGDDGSYPISVVATSTITFYADINGDGSVERVRYFLQSGTLYRGVTYSTSSPPTYSGQVESINTLATSVVNSTSSPVFQYFDSSGNLLSAPITISQVASISTLIKIDVDPNRSPAVYTLTGSATLRNLRS